MFMRTFLSSVSRRSPSAACTGRTPPQVTVLFSSSSGHSGPLDPRDMPFLHHGKRPRFRGYEKFKSPRKRASILLNELNEEQIKASKEAKPKVWNVDFRVGDAVEVEMVEQGGIDSDKIEKMRGVVLGIFRKKLDYSILIRDIMFGEPVEYRILLHSPLLRSIRVIEKNFIFKGKRKVKRAKLYYLRDRNPELTRVTKW